MSASKPNREILHNIALVSVGSAVLTAIMIIVYFLIGKGNSQIILSALIGTVVGSLDYYRLAVVIQQALSLKSPDAAQSRIKASYNTRLIIKLLIGVFVYVCPATDVLSYAIPLFFPKIVILILQAKEHLTKKS